MLLQDWTTVARVRNFLFVEATKTRCQRCPNVFIEELCPACAGPFFVNNVRKPAQQTARHQVEVTPARVGVFSSQTWPRSSGGVIFPAPVAMRGWQAQQARWRTTTTRCAAQRGPGAPTEAVHAPWRLSTRKRTSSLPTRVTMATNVLCLGLRSRGEFRAARGSDGLLADEPRAAGDVAAKSRDACRGTVRRGGRHARWKPPGEFCDERLSPVRGSSEDECTPSAGRAAGHLARGKGKGKRAYFDGPARGIAAYPAAATGGLFAPLGRPTDLLRGVTNHGGGGPWAAARTRTSRGLIVTVEDVGGRGECFGGPWRRHIQFQLSFPPRADGNIPIFPNFLHSLEGAVRFASPPASVEQIAPNTVILVSGHHHGILYITR